MNKLSGRLSPAMKESGTPRHSLTGWLNTMTARLLVIGAVLTAAAGFAVERKIVAQSGLKVSYGANGVQEVSYRGVTLEDLQKNPTDAFHIWHMKVSDLTGAVLDGPQDTWGESATGKQWDATSQT